MRPVRQTLIGRLTDARGIRLWYICSIKSTNQRRRRRRSKQMDLPLEEKFDWGGKREHAGRKREGGTGLRHEARPEHDFDHPVHATWRVVRAVGCLRAKKPFAVIRKAIKAATESGTEAFRIVHYSVQGNHLHLIVEAADARALGRGMQGLAIRIAKGVNRLLHRIGPVFVDRYHRHDLEGPRETRAAIAYVLQNFRRHAAQRGERCSRGWIDPCSSGKWFDGWSTIIIRREDDDEDDDPPPVASPKTWFLRSGWQKFGLIGIDEIPGQRARCIKRNA